MRHDASAPPSLSYRWVTDGIEGAIEFVLVPGTAGRPYPFGEGSDSIEVEVRPFYLATVPVTQGLWVHAMGPGSNPACGRGDRRPLENVSWDGLHSPDGFFARVNAVGSRLRTEIESGVSAGGRVRFRLPSETEWEYAARGGPHWPGGSAYGGRNEIDDAAWYRGNSDDRTHDVARKAANPLGLFDTSGNVWEWCEDVSVRDVGRIPRDGTPYAGPGPDRVLRGGCFHNWAIHCTVSKRYEIASDAHDGCIGFRLAFDAEE